MGICPLGSFVLGIQGDDGGGKHEFIDALRVSTCGSNTEYNIGFNVEYPGGWGLSSSCSSGYDAVSGYERDDDSSPAYSVWGLSFRCSASGMWTAPLGSGPAGVTGAYREVHCPAGWLVSGLELTGNSTTLGSVLPYCSPDKGINYDPIATCPLVPSATLLPGYYLPGSSVATEGTVVTEGVMETCAATKDCNAVTTTNLDSSASGDRVNIALSTVERSQLYAPGDLEGLEGCWGTFMPSPADPAGWYCTAAMAPPPKLTVYSESTLSSITACKDAADAAKLDAFATGADGVTCYVLTYDDAKAVEYPAQGLTRDDTYGALCWRLSAPWNCSDSGVDVSGNLYNAFQAATPEICKWECDKDFDCTLFFYNSTNYGCYLRNEPYVGTDGSNTYAIQDDSRVCVKTPFHQDYGIIAPPTRSFYG
ncbi:hypothetical protein GPECTOR_52g38 [Gonium pectorale]|uniref:Apple domain-containing protein n=1 Tax=Gonium pectorale TaxID=33097 RepID=A0A150G717_GONPE|nr:hypothetical protein GPECTOR_52g38 [Gonium pectorale]|eukprot:KXZ45637.1 hypothetical protein GPECTOR_52g38 [Gonium pectorale]